MRSSPSLSCSGLRKDIGVTEGTVLVAEEGGRWKSHRLLKRGGGVGGELGDGRDGRWRRC